MTRAWLAVTAVLLAGCGEKHPAARQHGASAGDRLEAAAIAAGVVADPARTDATGLYARGDDRLCVVPGAAGAAAYRIGVLVRYDDAQGCTARGSARRADDRLDIALDDCRFAARFEGDRIVFPADLPAACDRQCTGRASLGALAVERLSDGAAEASAQHDPAGAPLCG